MIGTPVQSRAAIAGTPTGGVSAQARQLVVLAVLVVLLALLAIGATLHTGSTPQPGYVNGSFGTDQRADYGSEISQRVAPQRAAFRG